MKIEFYCKSCNKWYSEDLESLETTDSPREMSKDLDELGLPSPVKESGYKTYSLVHADHIMVIDVDYNGQIRFEKIIERIGIDMERLISKISSNMLNYVEKSNKSTGIVIHSISPLIHQIILGAFNQVQLNIKNDQSTYLDNRYLEKFFRLKSGFVEMDFQVGHRLKEVNPTLRKHHIVHITNDNLKNIKKYFVDLISNGNVESISILFDSQVTNSSEWSSLLTHILSLQSGISLSDCDTPLRAAVSIVNILEKILVISAKMSY